MRDYVVDHHAPPGNRLEALAGDRARQHAIRINARWRVCFVWRDGAAHDVEIAHRDRRARDLCDRPGAFVPALSVGHLGMSTVHARFDKMSGKITLERAGKSGALEVKIDTASITTGDAKHEPGSWAAKT